MNVPAENSLLPIPAKPVTSFVDQLNQHPATALLVAAGLGFATVLIARALISPPPPRNRAVQSAEDLLHRLQELAQPAYDRAVSLAEDGAHVAGKGVNSLKAMHLGRKCDKAWRGFTSLFH